MSYAATMSKEEVEKFLSSVDLRTPLEEGLNAAVSYLAADPASFFSNFFYAKEFLAKIGCVAAALSRAQLPALYDARPLPARCCHVTHRHSTA